MNVKLIIVAVAAAVVLAGAGGIFYFKGDGDGDKAIDLVANDVHLDIFGNADGNSRIDGDDVKIIQRYLNGSIELSDMLKVKDSAGTSYYIADANRDGQITSADVDYVNALIKRTADKVHFLDGYGNMSSCKLNINKIISEYTSECELLSLLGVQNKIVSVGNAPYQMREYFLSNMSDSSSVYNLSNMHSPDYEALAALHPDVWIAHLSTNLDVKKQKSQADVFSPNLTSIDLKNPYNSGCVKGALLMGYIFNNTPAAEKYANWIIKNWTIMNDNTKKMAASDKPTALYFWYGGYLHDISNKTLTINGVKSVGYQALKLAGGNAAIDNIAPSLIDNNKIGIESLVDIKADYLFVHTVKYQGDGKELAYIPSQGFLVDDSAELATFQSNLSKHTLFNSIDNKNKYITCNELWHGGSGGVLLAAQIGHILHPDLYSENYLKGLLQEYVDLTGFKYDASKHGVFWYFNK